MKIFIRYEEFNGEISADIYTNDGKTHYIASGTIFDLCKPIVALIENEYRNVIRIE